MKTNGWTYAEMLLQVQVNQKKPKKTGENTGNKKNNKFDQGKKQFNERCSHCGNMAIKTQIAGNIMENPMQSQNKKNQFQGQK